MKILDGIPINVQSGTLRVFGTLKDADAYVASRPGRGTVCWIKENDGYLFWIVPHKQSQEICAKLYGLLGKTCGLGIAEYGGVAWGTKFPAELDRVVRGICEITGAQP